MPTNINLNRFLDAQAGDYATALAEIKRGKKQSHWMWYIFPQMAGLGFSETARFYGITDLSEARAYVQHPILGTRLIEISMALLQIEGKTANQILGSPDDLKLRSSMTLFSRIENADPVFQAVLTKYFNAAPDPKTLALVKSE